MRTLIICAAAALTLTACQRPAEEADETPMADDAAMDAATSAPDGPGAGSATAPSGGTAARAAGDAAADTAGMAPADDGMAAPSPSSSPVSQETRDGAKEKAEATNLHPKT